MANSYKFKGAALATTDETYIYCAWAKAPLVNSEGVPCNAR